MLRRVGPNRWTTKKFRWREDCFKLVKMVGVNEHLLQLKGIYKRSLWDFLAGNYRVPTVVGEEMLRSGAVDQYIPVEGLDIVLVKCNATTYGIYMERQPFWK